MRVTPKSSPSRSSTEGTLLQRIARRIYKQKLPTDPALEDIAIIQASGRFDKHWYLQHNLDVAGSGVDPILHYVRHGATEGRDPTKDFSTDFYLRHNPDVAASDVNPFRHYIEYGEGEGRPCRAADAGEGTTSRSRPSIGRSADCMQSDMEIVARSGLFDPEYYLRTNRDVAAFRMDPLFHFCRYGFKELRDPSPAFDITWYWLKHLPKNTSTNPLVHYLQDGARFKRDTRAVGRLSHSDRNVLFDAAMQLLDSEQMHTAELYTRLGIAFVRLKKWAEASTAYSKALMQHWDHAKTHARLAEVLAQQGKWWQTVESWSVATKLDTDHASWFFHLGEAQEQMNRFELAASAYLQAIAREPGHAQWHYRLGYAYERNGQAELASAAYGRAIALDPREEVRTFGIGVFHQKRGYWPEAAAAYARQLERVPLSPGLHYRLGLAHDRCYRWREAENAYRAAIMLRPTEIPSWYYRLGFVLERQQHWLDAADAYATAAKRSSKYMPYWHYRRGYVLAKAERYEEACFAYVMTSEQQTSSDNIYDQGSPDDAASAGLAEHFNRSRSEEIIARAIAQDPTRARWHYRLGKACEHRGDWIGAARAYGNAVSRSDDHRSSWYYQLGFVLFRAGKFVEACNAFRETFVFGRPYGIRTDIYSKNSASYGTMQYREYVDTLPIQGQTVLYESANGASVSGNPFAIFEYLLDHPSYQDWTHVWVIAPGVPVPSKMRSRSTVILVKYGSDLHRRYLATASHLINDSAFPYWFSRRSEQRYLNIWHETPLKVLGKSIRTEEEFFSYRNIQRNLLHATHLISPNPHTSDVLMRDFDIAGVCTAKLAESGYPRIDRIFNASDAQRVGLKQRLNLAADIPVVFYVPTQRGASGRTEADLIRLRSDLQQLTKLPCQWLLSGDAFSAGQLAEIDLPVTIASRDIDTTDLLAITDVLVTDYSSIFFDFLPTRRPILFYCPDLHEYTKRNGIYFDMREMPGSLCEDLDGLKQVLTGLIKHDRELTLNQAAALARFCPHEDGHASKRTVEFFLEGDESNVVHRYDDPRPSLLIFGGHFAPNGINTAFLTLVSALQRSAEYHLSVAIEPNRIVNQPTWRAKFRELDYAATVIARAGRQVVSPEEDWVARRFRHRREFASTAMRDVFECAYRHEFRRCYGDTRFTALIDFDGYNPYWTCLFAFGRERMMRNACWLHSDLHKELVLKHPYLASQFAVYPAFDALVSVSERMAEVNRRKLSDWPQLSPETFRYCNNLVNAQAIVEKAIAPIDHDLAQWFDDKTTFLALGRLSPEKDHVKLIAAFAQIAIEHPFVRLVIIGDGPLKSVLTRQIDELGMGGRVVLAGYRSNPYPALASCSCLVLSSNHEGQSMVLLEAMVIGKPVIATDIEANRAVLTDSYGALVRNSVDGLANGMRDFLAGEVHRKLVDVAAYNEQALAAFESVLDLKD